VAFANAVSAAEGLAECYVLSGCSGTAGLDLNCSGISQSSSTGSVYDCEGYRLPTEAEWEYAARAETDLRYAGSNNFDDVSWCSDNASATPHSVATKLPNDWGLYDMSGNVQEWVWDWFGNTYYSTSPGTDPEGPSTGAHRAYRGGSWLNAALLSRVASRSPQSEGWPSNRGHNLGFRLARTIP
jgi:formylglycine-generating enzyme required for sulfatase activity